MKFVFITALLFPFLSLAQNVDVGQVNAEEGSTTTIEISKQKGPKTTVKDKTMEIVDGNFEIAGDSATMKSEAKKNWRTACNNWKKEFRGDNQKNEIILLSCGIPRCSGDMTDKTCTSQAVYKIKTKMTN